MCGPRPHRSSWCISHERIRLDTAFILRLLIDACMTREERGRPHEPRPSVRRARLSFAGPARGPARHVLIRTWGDPSIETPPRWPQPPWCAGDPATSPVSTPAARCVPATARLPAVAVPCGRCAERDHSQGAVEGRRRLDKNNRRTQLPCSPMRLRQGPALPGSIGARLDYVSMIRIARLCSARCIRT